MKHITSMRNPIRALTIVATAMWLVTMQPMIAVAAEPDGPSAFSIQAILPANQASNASYFDLRMEPNTKQTIQLLVTNSGPVALRINIALNPASSGLNGSIVYSNPAARDDSLVVSINDIAHIRKPVVEVGANSSELVDIDLTMPGNAIEGMVLGGCVQQPITWIRLLR